MINDNLTDDSKRPKTSIYAVVIFVCISLAGLYLLRIFLAFRSPWNMIFMGITFLLVGLYQFIFLKRVCLERELIEKNSTILEWEEPRKAWHITEARSFSPLFLISMFIIVSVIFYSVFAMVLKFDPPVHPNKDTLTFSKLPAFSAGIGGFIVALYATLWWTHVKVKFTNFGIQRLIGNSSTRIWKYDRVKSYHFEPLQSDSNVYTLLILRNHKGKTWKITLADSLDMDKIECVLNEHGIQKLEKSGQF